MSKINIQRIRYVIVNDQDEIFCGLAQSYQFKPITDIGNTAIKTYLSENKAIKSFLSSWRYSEESDFKTGKYRVVKVTEQISEV